MKHTHRVRYVDDGLELDGLRVELWRSSIDGRLVVQVSNGDEDMQPRDRTEDGSDTPVFRLAVNDEESAYQIHPNGASDCDACR